MSEQVDLEVKEQSRTKVVDIKWGEYGDKNHKVLEVPIDWNLNDLSIEFYKSEVKSYDRGAAFIHWLIEKGAREGTVEAFDFDDR